MSEYIAVIRYERNPGMHTREHTIESLLLGVRGVVRVTSDAASAAALVWYNRAAVSVGELVRELEAAGIRVSGIAQCRSDKAMVAGAIA
jgi:hypothetical protein